MNGEWVSAYITASENHNPFFEAVEGWECNPVGAVALVISTSLPRNWRMTAELIIDHFPNQSPKPAQE